MSCRGRDWIQGRVGSMGWKASYICIKKKAAQCYFHWVSLNFTLSWSICSGVFNVASFRGAEMVQVLRTMNEGRWQCSGLHVRPLEDRGLMRLSTITDLGERQRESPDLSTFDYCQLSPDLMLITFQFHSGICSLGQSPLRSIQWGLQMSHFSFLNSSRTPFLD